MIATSDSPAAPGTGLAATPPAVATTTTATAASLATPAHALGTLNSASGELTQGLLGFGGVLALIFALAWLVRRLQRARSADDSQMEIRAGLQIGHKERVLWLRAGDSELLIAVAPSGVRTLHVFGSAPAAEETFRAAAPPRPAAAPRSPAAPTLRDGQVVTRRLAPEPVVPNPLPEPATTAIAGFAEALRRALVRAAQS